jgi:hypothetical protein
MKLNALAVCAAGLLAFAASQAAAAVTVTTLDFDYLTSPGGGPYPTQVTLGYSVTPAIANGLFLFSSRNPYNADQDGATITQGFFGMPVRIARLDGALFDLKSIDLTDYFNSARAISVAFSFTGADGAVTSQVFRTDAVKGLQTFAPDLKNLRSFALAGQGSDYVQFDNVVLSSGAANAVPEPATWALMLMGFFGLGSALRTARRVSPTAA